MTAINLKSESNKTLGVSKYVTDEHASHISIDTYTGDYGRPTHAFAFLDAEESRSIAKALNDAADAWDEENKRNVPEHLRPVGTVFSASPIDKLAFYTFVSMGDDQYESLSLAGLTESNKHTDADFKGADFGKTFYALHPVGSDCKIEATTNE